MSDQELAEAILAALRTSFDSDRNGLENAIRVELLVTALTDAERPRTLAELAGVLQRISAGEVAEELLAAVQGRAGQEPDLELIELTG